MDELYLKAFPPDPITAEGTLYYQMSLNAPLDSSIDISNPSSETNGRGVYELSSTQNDTYPIYYYRGAVDNNNVLFANFCWKIVRTTETGGIKIIYNGVPTDGTCDNTGTDSQIGTSAFNESNQGNAHVGYMYGQPRSSTYEEEHANTNDSTIKTTIDNWYASNMTSYTSKLEDTVWCNDRSVYSGDGYGESDTTGYYGAYNRLHANKTPSIVCSQENDKFTVSPNNGNGALTYPVGLLTADEIFYAGMGMWYSSEAIYLNTGVDWWIMTPYSGKAYYADVIGVYSSGYLSNGAVYVSFGVRPALSLAPGSGISSGSGTVTDPYVVN